MCTQVYGNNDKSDIRNQADLQAAFEDIFFQYQVDMTWYAFSCSILLLLFDCSYIADLQAAFEDIFFQYQVDMTWYAFSFSTFLLQPCCPHADLLPLTVDILGLHVTLLAATG